MNLICSVLILLLTANAGHGAVAANSVVQSGDFLVFTSNATVRLAGGGVSVYDSEVKGDYALAVVSSTGSLRSIVRFPFDYLQQASLSLSPDLKYAFVSAAVLGKGLQMGIVVIKLEGKSPKVIRTVALPASKLCRSDNEVAPIAVGPIRNGAYDLYVSRICFGGSLVSYYRKPTSTDVLKLRYTLSTGKLKASSKKPYSRKIAKSSKGYSYFVRLQVIDGVPYGLLSIGPKTFKLVRLGGQKALAFNRFRDYTRCNSFQFTFASPTQFYGACNIDKSSADYPTFALVSVLGEKSTRGPIPPVNGTYVYDDQGLLDRRFDWEGLPAISRTSDDVFAVLGDKVNFGNKTLYKLDRKRLGSSPKVVFKFPQSVVSKPSSSSGALSIKELYIVP